MNSSFIFFFSLAEKEMRKWKETTTTTEEKEGEEKKLEKFAIYHSIKKSYILRGIFIDSTPFARYDVVDHVPYPL